MKTAAQIENGVCVNIITFDDSATAADYELFGAVELPEGYGIGDGYDGSEWTKAPQPEPTPEPTQEPTTDEILLDLDYRVTCLELGL